MPCCCDAVYVLSFLSKYSLFFSTLYRCHWIFIISLLLLLSLLLREKRIVRSIARTNAAARCHDYFSFFFFFTLRHCILPNFILFLYYTILCVNHNYITIFFAPLYYKFYRMCARTFIRYLDDRIINYIIPNLNTKCFLRTIHIQTISTVWPI